MVFGWKNRKSNDSDNQYDVDVDYDDDDQSSSLHLHQHIGGAGGEYVDGYVYDVDDDDDDEDNEQLKEDTFIEIYTTPTPSHDDNQNDNDVPSPIATSTATTAGGGGGFYYSGPIDVSGDELEQTLSEHEVVQARNGRGSDGSGESFRDESYDEENEDYHVNDAAKAVAYKRRMTRRKSALMMLLVVLLIIIGSLAIATSVNISKNNKQQLAVSGAQSGDSSQLSTPTPSPVAPSPSGPTSASSGSQVSTWYARCMIHFHFGLAKDGRAIMRALSLTFCNINYFCLGLCSPFLFIPNLRFLQNNGDGNKDDPDTHPTSPHPAPSPSSDPTSRPTTSHPVPSPSTTQPTEPSMPHGDSPNVGGDCSYGVSVDGACYTVGEMIDVDFTSCGYTFEWIGMWGAEEETDEGSLYPNHVTWSWTCGGRGSPCSDHPTEGTVSFRAVRPGAYKVYLIEGDRWPSTYKAASHAFSVGHDCHSDGGMPAGHVQPTSPVPSPTVPAPTDYPVDHHPTPYPVDHPTSEHPVHTVSSTHPSSYPTSQHPVSQPIVDHRDKYSVTYTKPPSFRRE
jgi:hypothetical protein